MNPTKPLVPLVFALLASAGFLGCAETPQTARVAAPGTPVSPAAEERITVSVSGRAWVDARIDGTRMHGAQHELAHFDDGYRGSSPSGFLFLSEPTRGSISGVVVNVASAITTIDYEHTDADGAIDAKGRWASKAFSLHVDRNRISISRAYCTDTYERHRGDTFTGTPSCWQGGRGARLHVPASFFDRPAGEQVVFLAAALP
jgi:hypothetical protein